MKKTILLFLFSIAYGISFAQPRGTLPDFYGCNWGSSQSYVRKAMAKKGLAFNRERSNKNALVFNAKSFGGFKTAFIGFLFYRDSLFKGYSVFMADLEPKTFDLYNDIKETISQKYHSPDVEKEDVKYPYKKGDPDELVALKLGYATISTTWFFKGRRCILIDLNNQLVISLQYIDLSIAERASAEGEKKNLNDF